MALNFFNLSSGFQKVVRPSVYVINLIAGALHLNLLNEKLIYLKLLPVILFVQIFQSIIYPCKDLFLSLPGQTIEILNKPKRVIYELPGKSDFDPDLPKGIISTKPNFKLKNHDSVFIEEIDDPVKYTPLQFDEIPKNDKTKTLNLEYLEKLDIDKKVVLKAAKELTELELPLQAVEKTLLGDMVKESKMVTVYSNHERKIPSIKTAEMKSPVRKEYNFNRKINTLESINNKLDKSETIIDVESGNISNIRNVDSKSGKLKSEDLDNDFFND